SVAQRSNPGDAPALVGRAEPRLISDGRAAMQIPVVYAIRGCDACVKLRQMRTTALWLSPTSFARERVLQWVAAAGILSRVRVTASSTFASVILRGVPGRESSASPFIPCSL